MCFVSVSHRRKQAEEEEQMRRKEKLRWEEQQREHEEDMRARLKRSESIEKAAEAAALVSQRSMNPREFFRQLSASSQSPTSPGSSRSGKPFRRYQRSLTDTAFIFSKAEERSSSSSSQHTSPLVSPFSRAPPSPSFRATSPPTSPDFRPLASPQRPRAPVSPPTSPPRPAAALPALPSFTQTNSRVEPRAASPTEPSAPPASPTLLASFSPGLVKNNLSRAQSEALADLPANIQSHFERDFPPQAPTAPLPENPQSITDLNTLSHVHTELVSDIGYKVQAVLVEEDEEEEDEEQHEEHKSETVAEVCPEQPEEEEEEEEEEEVKEDEDEEKDEEKREQEDGEAETLGEDGEPASPEEPVEMSQDEEEVNEGADETDQSEESRVTAELAQVSETEESLTGRPGLLSQSYLELSANFFFHYILTNNFRSLICKKNSKASNTFFFFYVFIVDAELICQEIKHETVILSTNGILNGEDTDKQNGIVRSLSPSDTELSTPELTGCYNLHGTAEEESSTEEKDQDVSENEQEGLAERQLCVRALYDYQAEDESEISFEPGDIIKDVETVDKAWWRGWSKDGRQGLFPANYVETI
uniref:Si:dkey-40c11.2 n=1 Tax=Salarias fasciatus TaxID=181472 RepID=A0A672FCH3_SALFA